MTTRRRTTLFLLAVLTIALLAAAAAFWTMRDGVGLTNDSRAYLDLFDGIARRAAGEPIADDEAMSRRFPPAYPALLAAGDALLDIGPQRVARLANVACLIASTVLVALLVWQARRSAARAAIAAALFAAATDTLNTHLHLWTEPSFTLTLLLSGVALERYLRSGQRRWLIIVATLAAVAILTRYAAAALVLAIAVTILLRAPLPRFQNRLFATIAFGLVPTTALLLWQLGAPQASAGVGQRAVTFAPIPIDKLDQGLGTLGTWIAWYHPQPTLARCAGIVTIAILLTLVARVRRTLLDPVLALPTAYLVIYPLFLLVSITFLDPATPLDWRILAPLHVVVIVLACATLGRPGRGWSVVVIALLVAQFASTGLYLAGVRHTGLGYASTRWRENQTIAFARTLPPMAPVFTTHHFGLGFRAERRVYQLPTVPSDAEILAMLDLVREGGGVGYLVYLNWPRTQKPFLTPGDFERHFEIQRIATFGDGRVVKLRRIKQDLRPAAISSTVPANGP